MHVAITGANRGIGLELARQLLARGDSVDAGVRDPAGATALRALSGALQIHACDVADEASVRAFAAAIGDRPVDLLVNNAGVFGERQSLEELDLEDVRRTIDVDALGPVRVSRALLSAIRRGSGKKIVHISSGLGSIGDNTSGGGYGYRMAKAALNMASRSIAVDFRGEKIISVVMNPGWVQTDMGGGGAPTKVEDSARGILKVIDGLTLEGSGKFWDYRGGQLEW